MSKAKLTVFLSERCRRLLLCGKWSFCNSFKSEMLMVLVLSSDVCGCVCGCVCDEEGAGDIGNYDNVDCDAGAGDDDDDDDDGVDVDALG